ncbi:hypothetical protein I3760_15G049800 [Carya illinoinensis]|nr:hypothetical protein I3760_15G049800 [Carya illinoinensis]
MRKHHGHRTKAANQSSPEQQTPTQDHPPRLCHSHGRRLAPAQTHRPRLRPTTPCLSQNQSSRAALGSIHFSRSLAVCLLPRRSPSTHHAERPPEDPRNRTAIPYRRPSDSPLPHVPKQSSKLRRCDGVANAGFVRQPRLFYVPDASGFHSGGDFLVGQQGGGPVAMETSTRHPFYSRAETNTS